jgi:hypothetical protein
MESNMKVDAKDLITAFNAVRTFDKPDKRRWYKEKEKDPFKSLLEYQETAEKFHKWLKDQEKLNKKEEQKEHKGMFGHMSMMQRTMFFALAGPPIGVLYVFGILALARAMAAAAGVH